MTVTYAFTARDVVTVTGPDAATYLQGQLSQDIANLPVGESATTFVLAPQGKVDGWGRIRHIAPETFEIDVDPGAGAAWQTRLARFLLRTKAEVSVEADVPTLAVRGEVLVDGLPALGRGVVGVDMLRVQGPGRPPKLPGDAVEMVEWDLEARRIRAGVPVWGAEMDESTIPATVGQWVIDSSVSFTKGCYTGQELVARIDSRGGNVPRHLVGVVVEGAAPEVGVDVHVDGAVVGQITSSAPDLVPRTSVGLLFVPRSIEVPADGRTADVGGVPATLLNLPIK